MAHPAASTPRVRSSARDQELREARAIRHPRPHGQRLKARDDDESVRRAPKEASMKTPTIDDVRNLIVHAGSPCLTISIPGHANAESRRSDWRSSLTEAKKALASIPGVDVASFLAPLESLTDAIASEPHAHGAMVFRTSTWIDRFQVSASVPRAVVVSDRFQVRPLLESLHSRERFFLLDLTHGRVALFAGDAAGLTPVAVPGLPVSFVDAVGTEHAERVVSMRGGGKGSTFWHGQGKAESTSQEDELKFVRAVDEALCDRLRNETAPLVVAGSGKLLPLFQSRCSYPYLMKEGVHGSFANASLNQLHALAWPIVQAALEQFDQDVVQRHREAVSGDHATDEITSIGRFAVEGRIRDLLLAKNAHLAGRIDPATGAVQIARDTPPASGENVLERLAETVVLRGGNVYVLDAERMPTRSPAAATLRW
jgi:hypothetical protein